MIMWYEYAFGLVDYSSNGMRYPFCEQQGKKIGVFRLYVTQFNTFILILNLDCKQVVIS